MKYLVVINDNELRDNGDVLSPDEISEEVGELLRSGFFQVEHVREL